MDAFSSYLPISVGGPQVTKLGPLLWLIYVNDFDIGNTSCNKYADDTTFYRANIDTAQTNIIQSAIEGTFEWSGVNSMILNTDKTVLMNTKISNKISHNCDFLVNGVILTSSLETKLLGAIVNNKLNFSNHADFLVSKCNGRLFLMRKLNTLGPDSQGQKIVYVSNMRSLLVYGAPVWNTLLSDTCKRKLEGNQRSATRVILQIWIMMSD